MLIPHRYFPIHIQYHTFWLDIFELIVDGRITESIYIILIKLVYIIKRSRYIDSKLMGKFTLPGLEPVYDTISIFLHICNSSRKVGS